MSPPLSRWGAIGELDRPGLGDCSYLGHQLNLVSLADGAVDALGPVDRGAAPSGTDKPGDAGAIGVPPPLRRGRDTPAPVTSEIVVDLRGPGPDRRRAGAPDGHGPA